MAPHGPSVDLKEALASNRSSEEMESPVADEKVQCSSSSSSSTYSSDSIEQIESICGYDERTDLEKDAGRTLSRVEDNALSRHVTGVSVATNMTSDPAFEVDFEEDDDGNPKNWPMWYRCLIIFFLSFSTMTVVLYSTSYTSGIPGMMRDFNVHSETPIVLGITTYLIGLAVGSVILAPLSEMYGRRPIYICAQAMFCVLIIPCGLAKRLDTILVTRFFGAIAGSAMIGNAPGTVNDIVREEYRALAFSVWSLGPMNGPVIGPLIGGFVFQYLGWRWTNWVVMMASGVTFAMVCLIRETYAPTILRKRAATRRRETGDDRWFSRYDDKKKLWPLLKVNLSRPFTMTVKEPILIFWDIYIAVVYGILYLCFVAYPIVFSGERGWQPGFVGLAYSGLGLGSVVTILLEPTIRKMINRHKKDPETGKPPPESMISVVCIASICIPVGEFIFSWTCTPNVHWIFPILAGIPFGAGNCAVFIYASNYIVHSYGIYAASALAGNAVFRSLMGGTLPLAGPAMYESLGPHWAGTMLAFSEVALIPIPFVFYRYGHRIRRKSPLIRKMQEDKARLEGKKRRAEEKRSRLEPRLGVGESQKVVSGAGKDEGKEKEDFGV